MPTAFTGFGPAAYPFLRALGDHQSKEWFAANRDVFDNDLKGPAGDLVEHLAAALARKKSPLTGSRTQSLFRMNRDVRFAKDKSPYKTHVGLVLSRTGTKKADGILYVHIDPAGSFLAAGFYLPEPAQLFALRSAIRDDPAAFRKMAAGLTNKGLTLSRDDTLVRVPKGFEDVAGDDGRDAVRLKSYIVSRPADEAEVRSPALADAALELAADAGPLLKWGWAALDLLAGAAVPPPRRTAS